MGTTYENLEPSVVTDRRTTVPDTGHVFALAGLAGSGKSTAADIIVGDIEHNFERAVSTEVSDFVRTLFEEQSDESVNDNELGRWAAEKKAEHGDGYFLREMANVLDSPTRPHTAISGLRSPEEAAAVRDVFGAENVTVISIWTLPDIRFERKYGDTPSEDHPKWDEFCERNERETFDWGCVEFFMPDGPQDYIVPNNSTLDALGVDLGAIVGNEVHDQEMPEQWRGGWYPFPEGLDKRRVAQYL